MKRIFATALMIMLLAFFSNYALAGEQAKEGNWDFNLSPLYIWMVNMDGDLGIGPVDTGANIPFKDIFDNLESIFTVHFEGLHRSNWVFSLT